MQPASQNLAVLRTPSAIAGWFSKAGLSASPASQTMLLVGAFLILRIGLAAVIPLSIDEAYAVVVSRSHSLSYFDHPPLGFALGRLMADITG